MSLDHGKSGDTTPSGDETLSTLRDTAEVPSIGTVGSEELRDHREGEEQRQEETQQVEEQEQEQEQVEEQEQQVEEQEQEQQQQQVEEQEQEHAGGRSVAGSGSSACRKEGNSRISGSNGGQSPMPVKSSPQKALVPHVRRTAPPARKTETTPQTPSSRPPLTQRSNTLVSRRFSNTGLLAPLFNANNMTTQEEYMAFRARNGVAPNYVGPVFVVEEVHVSCARCGGPVDAVTRVPAGKLFFHPQCICCELCGRRALTDIYFQSMSNRAICSECSAKGFARCVSREAASSRGIVVGAVNGSIDSAIKRHDRKQKLQPSQLFRMEGVTPPTLALNPLQNPSATTSKAMALIQRQQYYTQNDNNIFCISLPENCTSNPPSQATSPSRSGKH